MKMKKFLAGLVVLFVLMISVPLAADAQTRCRKNYAGKRNNQRPVARKINRYRSNSSRGLLAPNEYIKEGPSFYRRHRNLINLGIGTGGGALVGALAGGKRGALIGTAVGAGGSALYTYVLNPKKRRYVRR